MEVDEDKIFQTSLIENCFGWFNVSMFMSLVFRYLLYLLIRVPSTSKLDGVGQFSVNMEVAQLNECKNIRTKYEDLTPEIPVLGLIFAGVTQHLCPV